MNNIDSVHSIFDRKKSGYKRDFNPFDVFIFNVMGFSLGLALSTNSSFIGGFAPSADLVFVILLGALLAFFNGLLYGWFGAIMPSTGGDFVFVSRSLNHRLGFLTSWGFTICQIYGLAMNVGWMLMMAFIPSLVTIGYSFNNQHILDFASNFSSHYMLYGSIGIIILYYLISISGFTLNRLLSRILFIIGILGPLLIAWTLYTHTQEDFILDFNTFMKSFNNTPDAYNSIIESARNQGMEITSSSNFFSSIKAIPLGFLCFVGFTYSVYIGGEVEKPRKSQIRGILGALLLGVFTFLLCMGKYISVVGQEFNASIGNFDVVGMYNLPSNSMNFIAGILCENPVINIIMQLGNIIWFLLVPYVMLQVCIRNFIAWTCDDLLPEKFLYRTKKTNSPHLVTLIITLIAIFFVLLNNFWGVSLIGAISLIAVAFLFTGLGAVVLQTSNPKAYEGLPDIAKNSLLGFSSNIKIVGLFCILGFSWIIYASIFYPEISGGSSGRALRGFEPMPAIC